MNFQNECCYKYSSTFEAKYSKSNIETNPKDYFLDQHQYLNNIDSNFYWKSNYYLTLNQSPLNFTAIPQLYQQIQICSMKEHKQVIAHILKEVQNFIQISESHYDFYHQDSCIIKNNSFADFFFQQFIYSHVFLRPEADQFKQLLTQHKDLRKISVDLMQSNSKLFYWELTYLLYKTVKFMIEFPQNIKFNLNESQASLHKYVQQEGEKLKQRLNYLKELPNFNDKIQKIMYSMMLCLCGFFINKYYDSKKQQLVEQKEIVSTRNRKFKILNLSGYRMLNKALFQKMHSKKIKTSASSNSF